MKNETWAKLAFLAYVKSEAILESIPLYCGIKT